MKYGLDFWNLDKQSGRIIQFSYFEKAQHINFYIENCANVSDVQEGFDNCDKTK